MREASTDMNLYALEKQVESKLRDARATSARQALVSSVRLGCGSRFSVLGALASMRTGRWLLRRVAPASAESLAAPIVR